VTRAGEVRRVGGPVGHQRATGDTQALELGEGVEYLGRVGRVQRARVEAGDDAPGFDQDFPQLLQHDSPR
jgi:hypothetical protein